MDPDVPERERGDPTDDSKISVVNGIIHYFIYRQDGTKQPMTAADRGSNRPYVSWIQIHDRYTGSGPA